MSVHIFADVSVSFEDRFVPRHNNTYILPFRGKPKGWRVILAFSVLAKNVSIVVSGRFSVSPHGSAMVMVTLLRAYLVFHHLSSEASAEGECENNEAVKCPLILRLLQLRALLL